MSHSGKTGSRYGTGIFCVALIVLGVLAWNETYSMTDAGAYVFPRTVIILMMIFAGVLCVKELVSRNIENHDSVRLLPSVRQVVLVVTLLLGVPLWKWIGFLPASLVTTWIILIAGIQDRRTARRLLAYLGGLSVMVLATYFIFSRHLFISFPVGKLFS